MERLATRNDKEFWYDPAACRVYIKIKLVPTSLPKLIKCPILEQIDTFLLIWSCEGKYFHQLKRKKNWHQPIIQCVKLYDISEKKLKLFCIK